MQRNEINPRKHWQKKCEDLGFDYHTMYGQVYWDESAYYSFTLDQVLRLEKATTDVFGMCMTVMETLVRRGDFSNYAIPEQFWRAICESWDKDDPTIFGRFDFSWDGYGDPKLLEFNADTPTSLLEAGIVQWHWLRDVHGKKADQFNSLHEKLVTQWKYVAGRTKHRDVAFCTLHDDGDGQLITEDLGNVGYMAEVCKEAGFTPRIVFMEDIEWDSVSSVFKDGEGAPLQIMSKLYPWEWMVREDYSKHILPAYRSGTVYLEPLWKMVLSNKYFLVDLWEAYKGHPNLLQTSKRQDIAGAYVSKPLYSREGANVTIMDAYGHQLVAQGGDYGQDGYIYQQAALLPEFKDSIKGSVYPVIGSWVVGDEAAGMGIRESEGLITENMSRFVPHKIA